MCCLGALGWPDGPVAGMSPLVTLALRERGWVRIAKVSQVQLEKSSRKQSRGGRLGL